jgi:hypothetical protein
VKLIRLAVLSLGDRSDESWQWRIPIGDVVLFTHRIEVREHGMQVLIRAEVELEKVPEIRDHCVLVPAESRVLAERMIEDFADRAAIGMRTRRSLSSPSPEVAFADLSDEEKALFDRTEGMCVTGRNRHRIWKHLDLTSASFHTALQDRRDGVSLLAEALATGHATSRFRELVRLFERAFARDPAGLRKPLSLFLRHFSALDYTRSEVNGWIDLRHAATHADKRHDFAVEAEVRPAVTRVEQAAYDVLLNKRTWRDGSWDRRDVWNPIGGVMADDVTAAIVRGQAPISEGQLFDAFGVYPMHLNLPQIEPAEGWWVGIQGLKDNKRTFKRETIHVVESLTQPLHY